MKVVSQRQKKVSAELRAQIFSAWQKALQWEQQFNPSLLTITDLAVSPDLRQAFVLVSSLDPTADLERVVQRLNSLSGMIAKHLASAITLKRIPRLCFKPCDPEKARLEILLQSIRGASDDASVEGSEEEGLDEVSVRLQQGAS